MRVSYRWLCSKLGFEPPLPELIDRLTMAGLEVESVTDLGVGSGNIVVGKILEIGPHPNAENLVLCNVKANRPDPLRIVCGAKNMKAGDLVPVAVEGAKLPDGMVIKKSKIRGEASEGMMCSGREIGWGEDSAGLLILPPEEDLWKIGKPFDALIDIKITANRPDCLSILGIARDVAAASGKPISSPVHVEATETGPPVRQFARVRLEAPAECPRYMGRLIRDVNIAPSPLWLARAVESAGIRSINNVVDVTNYVLLELGHPLHAFDWDRIAKGEVSIRHAFAGEPVTTLDGQNHRMLASDLLIADAEKPIALAGIMGCGNSEISDETHHVFLECAYFRPATIRATAKRLSLSTESSYRFERGTDWEGLPRVLDRATQLIVQVAGGEVAGGVFDETNPDLKSAPSMTLRLPRVRALLGLHLSTDQTSNALKALGFTVDSGSEPDSLRVRVPAYRPDVEGEADLAEEIARIVGYDKIPAELPHIATHATHRTPEDEAAQSIRAALVALGFAEAINYTFQSSELFARLGYALPDALRIKNPLSAEFDVLRPDLLPGLLSAVLYNQNHGRPDVRLFEVGKVFAADGSERWEFAAVLSGVAGDAHWREKPKVADFYDGRATADAVAEVLFLEELNPLRVSDENSNSFGQSGQLLHPNKSVILKSGEVSALLIGEIHPRVRQLLDLKRNVVIVSGYIDDLIRAPKHKVAAREISQFPGVTRDLALIADKNVQAGAIQDVIVKRAKSLLSRVRLFDVFEGGTVPEGKRSLAYSLHFSAPDRTLKDDEVNGVVSKVLGDLKAKLGVELRT